MARELSSKPNVEAPSVDYPYGRVKNNPGDNTGTRVNELLLGDLIQFFEKLMDDAGVVANGQPENSNDGFQYNEALSAVVALIAVAKTGNQSMSGILTSGGFRTDVSQPALKKKVIEIGDWDMDTNAQRIVAHGIGSDFLKIRSIKAMIVSDTASQLFDLEYYTAGTFPGGGISVVDSTNIYLHRQNGGVFDGILFDQTSYNRGWVYIEYEA